MRYGKNLSISECPDVYPPLEDTFLMLESVSVTPGQRLLEMGCGTGLISCHCAKAGAEVTSVDINPNATRCTMSNAEKNGLRITGIESDLFKEVKGKFDIIIFNPPYLSVDDAGTIEAAWSGGCDGVRVLDRFLMEVPEHLSTNGMVIVLLSSEMDHNVLDASLVTFRRERLLSRRYFFEELWTEKLSLGK